MDRSNFDPQVGDSVRVRSWEDMKSHDGKYSGHEKGSVMLSVDMLEPIPEEEIDGTEIDDFLSAMKVN